MNREYSQFVTLIKAFLDMYPQAEWGAAHIVLSDYNLTDVHIDGCITDCEKMLAETPEADPVTEFNQDHTHEEIQATIDFLTFMKSLPEYWRNDTQPVAAFKMVIKPSGDKS